MSYLIDQLTIGDKSSFDDFMASLANRKIKMPAKKQIKETVPFSNKTYDFSDINGEVYWEERELEYIFEIIADNPELLEELKLKFADWIMNIKDEDIHDPFILDYHFKGTYNDMDFEDDEGLDKTTATVKFLAYPYKIANLPKVYEVTVEANETEIGGVTGWWGMNSLYIVNNSSHRVSAKCEITGADTVGVSFLSNEDISAEEAHNGGTIFIPKGTWQMLVSNGESATVKLKLSFYEEVF